MGTTMTPSAHQSFSRARGALLGLACGDALGTTLEFSSPASPLPFPALLTGPLRTIGGGGPFSVLPGQVTDDTQMAVCLATSLRAKGGYNVADAARRYEAWSAVAFDKGVQTGAALRLVADGVPAEEAGRQVWVKGGRQAAGNGSLMRTAPIGVVLSGNATQRRKAALLDSAITHFDPRCLLACASFDAAIAHAVGSAEPLHPGDLLTAAREEIPLAARDAEARWPAERVRIGKAAGDVSQDLAAAYRDDPGVKVAGNGQGFVRVAFTLAFWELLHAPTFEAGVVDVVNRGGDADTNGAIAGALLGAFHGEDAVPPEWRRLVLEAPPDERLGPLAEACHPRHLLSD